MQTSFWSKTAVINWWMNPCPCEPRLLILWWNISRDWLSSKEPGHKGNGSGHPPEGASMVFLSCGSLLEWWSNGVYEIPSSKHQITNKSQIPISNDQNRFWILNFGHCDLFDICDLWFGIFSHSSTPVLQNSSQSLTAKPFNSDPTLGTRFSMLNKKCKRKIWRGECVHALRNYHQSCLR